MNRSEQWKRSGITTTELVVAATLLVAIISLITPMTVRIGRIWRDGRQVRLAIGELSNQLDRLTSMDAIQREVAIADLTPSSEILEALPDAKLFVKTVRDEDGTRLVITMNWQRAQPNTPIALEGWIDATPSSLVTRRVSEGPSRSESEIVTRRVSEGPSRSESASDLNTEAKL